MAEKLKVVEGGEAAGLVTCGNCRWFTHKRRWAKDAKEKQNCAEAFKVKSGSPPCAAMRKQKPGKLGYFDPVNLGQKVEAMKGPLSVMSNDELVLIRYMMVKLRRESVAKGVQELRIGQSCTIPLKGARVPGKVIALSTSFATVMTDADQETDKGKRRKFKVLPELVQPA